MRLTPGVTGFGPVPDGAPTDFAAFKTACHVVARRLGGTVVWAESCHERVTPNFHRVALSLRGEAIAVICNARFPLAAVIRAPDAGCMSLAFIDVAGVADALAEAGGFQVIPAQELNAPIRDEHLAGLSWAERRQAAYWEPRTVGELVFNFWD